jgi:type IV secretion system protein VirB1
MDTSTFTALAMACAPVVHPSTAHALVAVESGFNPHAIGVVGGVLHRQPRSRAEALATVTQLQADGWNFSVGLAQINLHNFKRLGLTPATAFEPCENLRAMQAVLTECFDRSAFDRSAVGASGQASGRASGQASGQASLRQALSCYYSGNFVTGFRHGYVQRVGRAVWQMQAVSGVPP